MKFDLKKKKDELHVLCTVPPALKNNPPTIVRTQQVVEWLAANHPEYKLYGELKSGRANNSGHDRSRTGLWIFSLKQEITKQDPPAPQSPIAKTPAKKRAKRTPTVTLDYAGRDKKKS